MPDRPASLGAESEHGPGDDWRVDPAFRNGFNAALTLDEKAVYEAMKVHCACRGFDVTESVNAQALGPDEFRWMRSAIAAYLEARRSHA